MHNQWTLDAIMCYNRGCKCKGCFFEDFFSKPLTCQMKFSVIGLVRLLGRPKMTSEDKKQLRSQYIKNMKELEFPRLNMRNFYVTNAFNGQCYKSRCVDDLEFNLELCQREFNEEILKLIRKHPIKFSDSKELQVSTEEKVYKILNKLPEDKIITEPYWDKYWKAIDLCFQYVQMKNLKEI